MLPHSFARTLPYMHWEKFNFRSEVAIFLLPFRSEAATRRNGSFHSCWFSTTWFNPFVDSSQFEALFKVDTNVVVYRTWWVIIRYQKLTMFLLQWSVVALLVVAARAIEPSAVIDVALLVNDLVGETDDIFTCFNLDWWPIDKCDYGNCPWDQKSSIINLDVNNQLLNNARQQTASRHLGLS